MTAEKDEEDEEGENNVEDSKVVEQMLGEWLKQLREADAAQMAPLEWKGMLPPSVTSTCPFPIVALKRRNTGGGGPLLVGAYAGEAGRWLRGKRGRHREELALRGEGYTLYEAGRLCELLVWGHPFAVELVAGPGLVCEHAALVFTNLEKLVPLERLMSPRMVGQLMTAVQGQLKLLLQGDIAVTEDLISLAALLHAVRTLVVARVGPVQPTPVFNEWQYFRSLPIDVDFELDAQEKAKEEEDDGEEPTTPRPSRKKIGEASDSASKEAPLHLELDETQLRPALEELDELRDRWMEPGVLPTPMEIQAALDPWLLNLRLATL